MIHKLTYSNFSVDISYRSQFFHSTWFLLKSHCDFPLFLSQLSSSVYYLIIKILFHIFASIVIFLQPISKNLIHLGFNANRLALTGFWFHHMFFKIIKVMKKPYGIYYLTNRFIISMIERYSVFSIVGRNV